MVVDRPLVGEGETCQRMPMDSDCQFSGWIIASNDITEESHRIAPIGPRDLAVPGDSETVRRRAKVDRRSDCRRWRLRTGCSRYLPAVFQPEFTEESHRIAPIGPRESAV